MPGPIGREAEREVAATFVAAAVAGSAVLEIEGAAGIGKRTLFRFVVDAARQAGSTVLACGLTEVESELSFAGLTDLLRDVDTAQLELLPTPQRHALGVATLRVEPTGSTVDERTIGTGLAALLVAMADTHPLIVAVDDAQWLDQASASVLAFAFNRLGGRSLGLLTCRRSGMADQGLVATMEAPAWRRELTLSGVSPAAVFHIVRDQQGTTLARPLLMRITEASRGNPFLALELARASASRGETTEQLVLTESLHRLVAQRLETLSGDARDALLAAACSGRPTLALLSELGMRAGVEETEAARLVSIEHGRVVFDHPLLSAAVVQSATAPAIRAVHGRLGAVTAAPEERARHFAMANPEPDALTSSALDAAAISAESRGAMVSAAELARLALDRTPAADEATVWQRRLRLAQLLHAAGAALEAGQVLADPQERCPRGRLRAEVHLVLTEIAYQTATTEQAIAHAQVALSESAGDAVLRARALLSLASVTTNGAEQARFASEAKRGLDDADVDDPILLAWAASAEVSSRFQLGQGLDCVGLDHALLVERTGREWRSGDQVAAIRPVLLKWADRHDDALLALAELRERAELEGNEGLLPYVVGHVPGILLRVGRFADAAAAALEHLSLALATGQDGQRMQALYNVSLVDAHCGRLDAARTVGQEMLAWAQDNGDRWVEMSACAVLGFTAISAGQMQDARTWFDQWWVNSEAECVIDPGVTRFHGDHIEALIALGAITEAMAQAQILEDRAAAAGRVSAAAIAVRCRALLAATDGDQTTAIALAHAALELHAQCPIEFDVARTMLAKGVIHRRAKEKSAARQCLTEATGRFAKLGAEAFEARATAELDRIGTRVTSNLELTATERRIADLAASGLTNRQVAERSFMSAKSVEANLARVYRKLGIASRAELGAKMLHME